MNRDDILSMLKSGPLLFDGATGTYAKTLPGFDREAVELACLHAPERVYALHKAYLDAGCRVLKTNTFAAHVSLAAGDCSQQREIIRAAYDIACSAAKESGALVFADIGPAPMQADAFEAYKAMAQTFLELGAEDFLLETMPSFNGIAQTAAYIKQRNPQAFVAVSFAAEPDGFTRMGESAAALIAQADECEWIDAVGLNCICGAYHMRRLMETLRKPNKILMAMPNAGYPHVLEGRTYYDSDPVYYAQQAATCVSLGASIIGGCCGTTPEHMSRVARLLSKDAAKKMPAPIVLSVRAHSMTEHSEIRQKLENNRRPILVELDPPKHAEIGCFMEDAKKLKDAGADAITIADCPIGRASMDSSLLACKLKHELGMETLPHMTCRDRNVNATKALLLGLSVEGVHNVLVVTGDPVPASDRGSVKSVFQFNSRVLAKFIRGLSASGETAPFFLCGALNINAVSFDAELERALEKEKCGMEAFLTQPVLSEQAAKNLECARKKLSGKLFGGLFPVVSHRNAQFLQSEVAGIAIDDAVVRAYEGLDRMDGEKLAVRLCTDAAKRVAAYVDGFYIMTPFRRVGLVGDVIRAIREIKS